MRVVARVDPVQHLPEEPFGSSVEGNPSFTQRYDTREPAGHPHVVQVDQERGASAVELQQRLEDALGGDRVNGREGFVGKDEVGALDQEARNRHPLLLTAGEVRRTGPGLVPQTDAL